MTGDVTAGVQASAYRQLAQLVLGAEPLGSVLQQITRIAADAIPGADEVSLTLLERGRPRTVAFSGDLAAVLDERQYEKGFGPCLHAAATGDLVMIEDTARSSAYAGYADVARRAGIKHLLAVGLPVGVTATNGALNVYSRGEQGPLGTESMDAAVEFSVYASVAATNAALYSGALAEISQMREAIASRASIEQAKGVLMAVHRCSPEEAFDRLRATSMHENRKLRDVAQQVVEDAQLPL
jgi:GAF domain-containing protein